MSDNRNTIQLGKIAHGIIDLDGLCLCVADYAFIFTPPHNAIHACATKCVSTTQFHRKQFVTIVKLSFAIRTIHCLSFLLNTTKLSQRFATLKKIKSAANHFSLNRFHMDDVIPVERARYLWFREWTCKPGNSWQLCCLSKLWSFRTRLENTHMWAMQKRRNLHRLSWALSFITKLVFLIMQTTKGLSCSFA